MKYLKKFESHKSPEFRRFNIDGFDIKIVDAGTNNYDGGVQVDSAKVTCNGKEYYFELGTPSGSRGYVHVSYMGGDDIDNDFTEHFGLNKDEKFYTTRTHNGNEELIDFLQVNSPTCVGDTTEIDGYELEITDFSHEGGMEFGWIQTIINGKEVNFEMVQSAVGNFNYSVDFDLESDAESAKEIGFKLTEEVVDLLFNAYDTITAEKR